MVLHNTYKLSYMNKNALISQDSKYLVEQGNTDWRVHGRLGYDIIRYFSDYTSSQIDHSSKLYHIYSNINRTNMEEHEVYPLKILFDMVEEPFRILNEGRSYVSRHIQPTTPTKQSAHHINLKWDNSMHLEYSGPA